MKRAIIMSLASALFGVALTAVPAEAAITVCSQGASCIKNTTNVNLDTNTNVATVTGNVGAGGPLVTFSSTDGNLSSNSGAASVELADGGSLTNLTFTILAGFSAAEFNLEKGSPTSFLVDLTDSAGDSFSQTLSSLNGSNIFNIVAPAGTVLTGATFSSSGGGFADFKQLRVTLASAVPEPATWAMMLFGLGAIGFASRRRRMVAPKLA